MAADAKRPVSATSSAGSANNEIDKQLRELMVESNLDTRRASQTTNAELVGGEQEIRSENVVVMVRCRPLLTSEKQSGASAIQVDETNKSVQVDNERQFFFDQVFAPTASNEQVYMQSARRLVEFAFNGFNCTIFLYGQTGTGKTYTHSSLTASAFEHLFSLIQASNKQTRFLIRASYYELYNEEIRDLLATESQKRRGRPPTTATTTTTTTTRSSRRPSGALQDLGKLPAALELRESKERGVYIKDLTCFLVNNPNELTKLKQLGDKRRATAATKMNQHSSRSHSIFTITIEATTNHLLDQQQQQDRKSARAELRTSRGVRASQKSAPESLRMGRLHLIDLAGSERQSKSGSSGLQLKEASQINLSLTCLSLVIRALTDRTNATGHIPYRNSKLTRLLSSSLGGNSKTLLMACVSPSRSNLDETLNTLRFAARTKQIKNRAVINEDPKDALLRKYRRQLEELRERLEQTKQKSNLVVANGQRAPDGNQQQDQQQQLMMMKQLELLKAKIMFGGENLLDKVELHERLLEASRQELEERQRAETKLREELANKANVLKSVVHSRGSLESQRAYLDEKLNKAIGLYRQSKLDLRDLSSEHEQLKEQLLLTIRSTSKEIKYTDCILDDFIPHEYLDLINAYAHYDDESDEWQIKYIALSGNNIAQTRRLNVSTANVPLAESDTLREDSDRIKQPPASDAKKSGKRRLRHTNTTNHRPEPYIKF